MSRAVMIGLVLVLMCCSAWGQPYQFIVQPDPHLGFARALVQAALDAAGLEAELLDAPLCNEPRKLALLQEGRCHLDLMPATPERIKLYQNGAIGMIPVPLDRGLLGYRLNLLLESQRDLLADVSSIEDLREFTMGQGEGWMDVEVYRAAGIPTKQIKEWRNGEFVSQMQAGFFQLFPLGLEEALHYFLPHYRKNYPQLSADPYILVHYPWFRFVWVSPKAENADLLYRALVKGFDLIADNGVFLDVYSRYKPSLTDDDIRRRRIIEITNPFYDDSLVAPRYRHLLIRPAADQRVRKQ